MLSVSKEGYREKPTNIPQIQYYKKDLNLHEIEAYITNGHSLSANFTTSYDRCITQKDRTYANFVSTCFVMFDIDNDCIMPLEVLNESLRLKPTMMYTTYSHLQEGKGYRYRLLYIFEEPIKSIEVYQRLYDKIGYINGLNLKDNCGRNCTQNTFGSNAMLESFKFINNEITYHITELVEESAIRKYKEKEEGIMESDCTFERSGSSRILIVSNKNFMVDFSTMTMNRLLEKYIGCYPIIEESPIEEVDEDTACIIYPEDYISIRRRWTYYQHLYKNGKEKAHTTSVRRIRDGEGRRRKLFINGVIRRLITNDTITYDNLLYCLIYEFEHYYEYQGIGKKEIKEIADNVWNADISKYEGLRGHEHEFRVNPKFCQKYNLSKKQAMPIALKQFNSHKIGQLYDHTLTDAANVEAFRKEGLNISIRTLKQWRKENGKTKYKKKPQ